MTFCGKSPMTDDYILLKSKQQTSHKTPSQSRLRHLYGMSSI